MKIIYVKITIFQTFNNIASSVRSSVLVVLSVALLGCGESISLRWSEEVLLSGGQVIVVDRSAKGRYFNTFTHMDGWESTNMTINVSNSKNKPPEWSSKYVPIVLDYEENTGSWIIVATVSSCEDWNRLGRPASPYIEFRTDKGGWRQLSLEESMVGRLANMLVGPDANGESGLISIQEKKIRNMSAADRYKSVVRNWNSAC